MLACFGSLVANYPVVRSVACHCFFLGICSEFHVSPFVRDSKSESRFCKVMGTRSPLRRLTKNLIGSVSILFSVDRLLSSQKK